MSLTISHVWSARAQTGARRAAARTISAKTREDGTPGIFSRGASMPRYWLFKSEPDAYSFEHLRKDGTTMWSGVRNFQARNNMMEMQLGDLGLFYHSSIAEPAAVGICKVVATSHPDPTQIRARRRILRRPRQTRQAALVSRRRRVRRAARPSRDARAHAHGAAFDGDAALTPRTAPFRSARHAAGVEGRPRTFEGG